MAQSNTVNICQLRVYCWQDYMKTVTELLAILHRYNFEIKPVAPHPQSMFYVCTHRGSGVDCNAINEEMIIRRAAGKKDALSKIEWSFA